MPVGQVIRSHSHIFYVLVDGREVECRPRGRFRLDRQSVLAGDLVEVQISGEEGRIDAVLPRRSVLKRPAVANVDQTLVVFTLHEPAADFPFLDRVLVHAEQAGIRPLIILNKVDLLSPAELEAFTHLYRVQVGYAVLSLSATSGLGVDQLRAHVQGKVSVLAGHSGVGKSRLVIALEPLREDIRVGGLSERLGRGKHTTRHVELVPLSGGGLIVDTPGFTYLEFEGMERRDLPELFVEFARYSGQCRFDDCMHHKEPDCAVRAAVAEGAIAPSRHQNYLAFLQEVEAQKRW